MDADHPEVTCPTCGTRFHKYSESIVWIGYQPFHGDCLANFLVALGTQPMRRVMPPKEG